MSHVLIVEDEPDLARLLEFNLRREGLKTEVASSGEAAVSAFRKSAPELVLLDLMLPDLPGTEVCRQIRASENGKQARVIMLTAKGDEIDRVVGFQLGADDYVTKPFSMRELVLRAKAVLRRAEPSSGARRERVGPIRLDFDSHRCFIDEAAVELTALEFRLLAHFMARLGRVQSREQLLTDVWELPGDLNTRTVDTHVKRLREKLGCARDLIETVRGIGYRMVAPEGSS